MAEAGLRLLELATLTPKRGSKWGVVVLREGESKNRGVHNPGVPRYYPPELIRSSAHLFEGAWVYRNHASQAEREQHPARRIEDRVGRITGVRPVLAEDGRWELQGAFHCVDNQLRENLKNAWDQGWSDYAGFSIDAFATGLSPRTLEGNRTVEAVDGIARVASVDLVTEPAAGGGFRALLESVGAMTMAGENTATGTPVVMTPEALQALVEQAAARGADMATERVSARLLEALDEADEAEGDWEDGEGWEDDDGDWEGEDDGEAVMESVVRESARRVGRVARRESARLEEAVDQVRFGQWQAEARLEVREALDASSLPDASRERLQGQFERLIESGNLDGEDIAAAITEERTYLGRLTQTNPVGTPGITALREGTLSGTPEYYDRIMAMFGRGPAGSRPFDSLQEAFHSYPGHAGLSVFHTGRDEILAALMTPYSSAHWERQGVNLRESISTATFGSVMADVMYQSMLKEIADLPYSDWQKFVSHEENVTDFRDRRWIRTGGYDNLPTVAEGAPYQPVTSPDDEEATYRISKYGGLEDVTLEAVANDRVGAFTGIPRRMAYAWSRTVYELIMDVLFLSNPNASYDNVALYHNSHANNGSSALTVAGLNAVQVAMRKQVPYGQPATEYMGSRNRIKYLVVPPELEARANTVVNPTDGYSGSAVALSDSSGVVTREMSADLAIDPYAFKGKNIEVLVYDKISTVTTAGWLATADPRMVEMLVVGFFNGRKNPELFVQGDGERSGSAFTADKVTYKLRGFVGAGILDHRGVYRAGSGW